MRTTNTQINPSELKLRVNKELSLAEYSIKKRFFTLNEILNSFKAEDTDTAMLESCKSRISYKNLVAIEFNKDRFIMLLGIKKTGDATEKDRLIKYQNILGNNNFSYTIEDSDKSKDQTYLKFHFTDKVNNHLTDDKIEILKKLFSQKLQYDIKK